MNMKDAFRFQNKLKGLMCEATAILQDRRNIVKVRPLIFGARSCPILRMP